MAQSTKPSSTESLSAERTHSVHFYNSDDFLCDNVGQYVGRALAAGSAVLLIATEAHRREFEKKVVEGGFNLEHLKRQDRFISLDAADTLAEFMVRGDPDWELFKKTVGKFIQKASQGGTVKVCAYGEMVDLLWSQGKVYEAFRLEEHWNNLGSFFPFSLMCAYHFEHPDRKTNGFGAREIGKMHDGAVFESAGREGSKPRETSVLIAEDDDDDFQFVEEIFKKEYPAIRLIRAKDGEEAMSMLGTAVKKPSLILLDLNMPRKDGRQALSEIRSEEAYGHIPVVVITTSASAADKHFVENFTGAAFTTKPFSIAEYTQLVRSLVDRYRLA